MKAAAPRMLASFDEVRSFGVVDSFAVSSQSNPIFVCFGSASLLLKTGRWQLSSEWLRCAESCWPWLDAISVNRVSLVSSCVRLTAKGDRDGSKKLVSSEL